MAYIRDLTVIIWPLHGCPSQMNKIHVCVSYNDNGNLWGDNLIIMTLRNITDISNHEPVFSCDQAALWMVISDCLSIRLSVCPIVTPFWLCSHHHIIMKFSGVITKDQDKVHAKGQGQRSRSKVKVTIQLNRFRTVTPVWIQIWWWNDAYSLMLLRRGALLFFKVIHQISRSHGSKNRRIWPGLGVPECDSSWIHQWLRNDAQSLK